MGLTGKSPPIPANDPAWARDAGGFVPDAGWYGEHSWADVRMRVAGHLSAAGRDRARILAERGDLAGAATAYDDLVGQLDAIVVPPDGTAAVVLGLLRDAARRDAALLHALAEERDPPVGAGLAGLRARYLVLGRGQPSPAEVETLVAKLDRYTEPRADLDLDAFADFDSRHDLRERLVSAYLDSLDPLGLDERWGYWEADEIARQARIIAVAARSLEDAASPPPGLSGAMPPLDGVPAWRRPSILAGSLHSPDQAPDFDILSLGALPTGDSLVDVAGQPGPRAIGTLERLGLDDPAHRAWLDDRAARLNAALARDAGAVPGLLRDMTGELDSHGHGSRYYNIKQIRNDGVRQLARAGRPDLALDVLSENLPLHHQDWACPNRRGILLVIEGRLLAEAGRIDEALARYALAREESARFLAQVDAGETAGR